MSPSRRSSKSPVPAGLLSFLAVVVTSCRYPEIQKVVNNTKEFAARHP
jgi:hypothetical protein